MITITLLLLYDQIFFFGGGGWSMAQVTSD